MPRFNAKPINFWYSEKASLGVTHELIYITSDSLDLITLLKSSMPIHVPLTYLAFTVTVLNLFMFTATLLNFFLVLKLFCCFWRKKWLRDTGSPQSQIDRCEFKNKRTMDKPEFQKFSIRKWLKICQLQIEALNIQTFCL